MEKISRQHPEEQDQVLRRSNFDPVEFNLTPEQAKLEASRCLNCKNPMCKKGCPVSVDIPEFIQAVKSDNIAEAGKIIRKSNMLPSVCGRVCPQERQCESKCILGIKGESVAIGALERYVGDNSEAERVEIVDNHKKVAIVGSGCAGMSAAADLRNAGFDVEIFEALHEFGGVLRYGIPSFRLPRTVLDREIKSLQDIGVKFHKNVVVGKSITIKQLQDEGYEAIFICSGAGLPKMMNIKGENLNGVYSANEFLTRVNLMHAHKDDTPTPIKKGDIAIIIGGGNVAMDAARVAVRAGYSEVHIAYRRTEAELPARKEEIRHAKEEGIIFDFLMAPIEILGENEVSSMRFEKMELGEPDESGRRSPIGTGEFVDVKADAVIVALGTGPNPIIQKSLDDDNMPLELDKKGYIVIDEGGSTSLTSIYAGGDVAPLGSSTAINAMGAGKRAAKTIIEKLGK